MLEWPGNIRGQFGSADPTNSPQKIALGSFSYNDGQTGNSATHILLRQRPKKMLRYVTLIYSKRPYLQAISHD